MHIRKMINEVGYRLRNVNLLKHKICEEDEQTLVLKYYKNQLSTSAILPDVEQLAGIYPGSLHQIKALFNRKLQEVPTFFYIYIII